MDDVTNPESESPANPDPVASAAGEPASRPETASAGKSAGAVRRGKQDYWIAGLIIVVVAAAAGPEVVKWIGSSSSPGASVGVPVNAQAASLHINLGMTFYNASNFAKAEDEFRKAVDADPSSALAYNDLGAALNAQKRWNEAIPVLQRAMQFNPALELARNNLAYAMGQRAKGGNPTSPEAAKAANQHIDAGMVSYNAGDFSKAEAEFRAAVQNDPASALAYNDLGAVLNAQKRWDEAIPVLRRAVELNPLLDLAKNNLAYAQDQKAKGGNGRK